MSLNETANRTSFGLLPEPEGRSASFVTSMVVNGLILLLVLYIGTMARKTLIQRQYQETLLILPSRDKEPPPPGLACRHTGCRWPPLSPVRGRSGWASRRRYRRSGQASWKP